MKKSTIFTQLKNNPNLRQYSSLCFKFCAYLQQKENIQIIIEGYDAEKQDTVFLCKPYMHRWKPEYMKARLAKLYLLDEWAKENPMPLTMLTFTTYHNSTYARRKTGKGYTIEESWVLLKDGYWKSSLLIRNKIRKNVPYFWVVEPHPTSGYPHIHAGYFTEFNKEEKKRLKNHWSNVVKAGNYERGLNFSFEQNFKNGEVASLRNYLMKYMGKTFIETMPEWSPEELVFNAIAWNEGYRMFGCSRNLSKVMSKKTIKNPAFTCLSTSLHWTDLGSEEDKTVWNNPTIKKK